MWIRMQENGTSITRPLEMTGPARRMAAVVTSAVVLATSAALQPRVLVWGS